MLIGCLGHTKGLHLSCQLDGPPCRCPGRHGVSTISLVQLGILLGILSAARSPTNTQLLTETGEKAGMRGRNTLRVQAGDQEFWLAVNPGPAAWTC